MAEIEALERIAILCFPTDHGEQALRFRLGGVEAGGPVVSCSSALGTNVDIFWVEKLSTRS